jgi:hypothetical protein
MLQDNEYLKKRQIDPSVRGGFSKAPNSLIFMIALKEFRSICIVRNPKMPVASHDDVWMRGQWTSDILYITVLN